MWHICGTVLILICKYVYFPNSYQGLEQTVTNTLSFVYITVIIMH